MYYIPLIVLLFFCILEQKLQNRRRVLFVLPAIMLILMASLRYGQGTDYFGYMRNYYFWDAHSEVGYRLLSNMALEAGISFENFVFCISLFQMLCFARAIMLYSPYPVFSLLLLYPTIYLTYVMSAIRQGMVAAFFLGFMLKWILDKKWIRYLLACIFLFTIHSAAVVLLLLPLLEYVTLRFLHICLSGAAVAGIFIYLVPKSWFSFIRIGTVQYYLDSISISYIGLGERMALFVIVTALFSGINRQNEQYGILKQIYKIYYAGFIISVLFFPWSLLSSRMGMFMKTTEILLIPMLMYENRKWRQVILAILLCYLVIMTTKNISMYIRQGGYTNFNVITYPYLSVLDKDYAHQIRKNNQHLLGLQNAGIIE